MFRDISAILASAFLLVLPVSAQETPAESSQPQDTGEVITVATVNMHDASLEPSDQGGLTMTFGISNRVGVQSGIRYGLELRTTDGVVVDSMVAPDAVTLKEGESRTLSIPFMIPSFLPTGSYEAWATSHTSSGLLLGLVKVGDVGVDETVIRSGVYTYVSACRILSGGEEYPLTVWPTLSASQEATLSCPIENLSSTELSILPKYDTYRESISGNLVSETMSEEAVTLSPRERKTFTLAFPREAAPQLYEVGFSLLDATSREKISNLATFGYMVPGSSATIRNVVLDKASYMEGETSNVQAFFDRQSGLPEGKIVLSATLMNGEESCSDTKRQEVTEDQGLTSVLSLDIPVTSDCPTPSVSVALADVSGNMLDSGVYGINPVEREKSGISPYAVVGTLSLIAILAILVAVIRRKKNRLSFPLFLILLPIASFLFAGEAKADTFASPRLGIGYVDQGTININKSTPYSPGEQIVVSGSVRTHLADNEDGAFKLVANNNGMGTQTLINTERTNINDVASCQQGYTAFIDNCTTGTRYAYCDGGSPNVGTTISTCLTPANASCSNVTCKSGSTVRSWAHGESQGWGAASFEYFSGNVSFIASSSGSVTYTASLDNVGRYVADPGYLWSQSSSLSYTVAVIPPPAPTLTLTASPTSISAGGTSTLSWTSTNAVSCQRSGGWSGTSGAAGAMGVSPATTTSYSLECFNSANVSSGIKTVTVTVTPLGGSPVGSHESANSSTCSTSGWACDADSYSSPVTIHFYQDGPYGSGTLIGSTTASSTRGDIASSCGGTTAHGFNYTLPASLKDNIAHQIYAYAVNIGAGYTSLLSGTPKSIQCTNPVPPVSPVLKVCRDACNSGVQRTNFTLLQNSSENLVACYNTASGCTDASGNYTDFSTWTEQGPDIVTLSPAGLYAKRFQAGTAAGTEQVRVSYGGQLVLLSVTVNAPAPVNTLKICRDACNSGIQYTNGMNISFGQNTSSNWVACYNTATNCSLNTGNVTTLPATTWTETGTNVVTLSNVGSVKQVRSGTASGTESIRATYSGSSVAVSATVSCTPTASCSSTQASHCSGETYTIDNGCGGTANCTGTRYCDFNWKEVAP